MEDSGVMSGDGVKEGRGRNRATVDGRKKREQQMQGDERLIPGIPNEVTIDKIATKLPWKAFHILSSVSRGWRRAIQSHQVYDARVRSKCTQPLVAFEALIGRRSHLFLYSVEDRSCYSLPLIPGLTKGIPEQCQCIFLDGKVYILGGLKDPYSMKETGASAEVYVLDVVGQRQWKQCGRMRDARTGFGCAAKDGKIYVFGGRYRSCIRLEPIHGSEVYDPKEDIWSPIKPIPSLRSHHQVTAVGEELFVHGGLRFVLDRNRRGGSIHDALSAEVYHPAKNEWRIVEHLQSRKDVVLMLGGNFHKLGKSGTQVYDGRANSWKPLQPFSSVRLNSSEALIDKPTVLAAVAVEDEFFAVALVQVDNSTLEKCLIRSKGVCADNKEIVWHKVPIPAPIRQHGAAHLSVIHF